MKFWKWIAIAAIALMPVSVNAQVGHEMLTNKSGGALALGDVVIVDTGNATAFTTTTTASNQRVVGVVFDTTIADDAAGLIMSVGSYVTTIKVTGTVAVGDFLITSTTAGRAASNGSSSVSAFAIATTANASGDGTVEGQMFTGPVSSSASGTTNILAVFTNATTLGDSVLSQSGGLLTATGGLTLSTNNLTLTTGNVVLDAGDLNITLGDIEVVAANSKITVGVALGADSATAHIQTSTGAGSVSAFNQADDLVVEGVVHPGISILGPDDQNLSFYFGSPTDQSGAFFIFSHDTPELRISTALAGGTIQLSTAGDVPAINIDASQNVTIPSGALTISAGAFIRTPITVTSDATPTAVGKAVIIIGSTAAPITNFPNEVTGQVLIILGGDVDGDITDGAGIELVGGVQWDSVSGATLVLVSDGTTWFEVSRSAT